MNIAELEISPRWFMAQKWLDLAKYQRHGTEWEAQS